MYKRQVVDVPVPPLPIGNVPITLLVRSIDGRLLAVIPAMPLTVTLLSVVPLSWAILFDSAISFVYPPVAYCPCATCEDVYKRQK